MTLTGTGAAARLVPGRGVELVDGTVAAAERVLLCTGLRPRRLPVSGGALTGVLGVRDLEDAERLRDAVARGGRTVVVGEGFEARRSPPRSPGRAPRSPC